MPNQMWMVRAGAGGDYVDVFLNEGIIAIGWAEIDDLSKVDNIDAIKERLKAYEEKDSWIRFNAGQIYRFRSVFEIGDRVVTYDPSARIYTVGEITSDYSFESQKYPEYPHIRHVNWGRKVERDSLSTETKNSLGAISTIFKISESAMDELLGNATVRLDVGHVIASGGKELPDEAPSLNILKQDLQIRAHEFIKDKMADLSWEDMERLAAGVIRAMGYKTAISPKGPDRGMDIFASPDGLGLESPRIKVEVKHRKDKTDAPMLRSFIATLRREDRGLYVSTGGFTIEAKYEADRAVQPVTLVDADRLADLIVQYYDDFDSEAKRLMPLQKLYWPV